MGDKWPVPKPMAPTELWSSAAPKISLEKLMKLTGLDWTGEPEATRVPQAPQAIVNPAAPLSFSINTVQKVMEGELPFQGPPGECSDMCVMKDDNAPSTCLLRSVSLLPFLRSYEAIASR